MIGGEQDGIADVNTFLRQALAGSSRNIARLVVGGKLLLTGAAPRLRKIDDISHEIPVTGGFAIDDRLRIIPPEPA